MPRPLADHREHLCQYGSELWKQHDAFGAFTSFCKQSQMGLESRHEVCVQLWYDISEEEVFFFREAA